MNTDTLIENKKLQNLLSISHLTSENIIAIINLAKTFIKDEKIIHSDSLKHKTVANIFLESSTRTRNTFELAAKNLGAHVINLDLEKSATQKGESLLDTIENLVAMGCNFVVLRHPVNNTPEFIADYIDVPVINAGDGTHSHPSQALLDLFTISQYKTNLSKIKIAIIGDIYNSRVARSQLACFQKMNITNINVIAPKDLLPNNIESLGVIPYDDLKEGLRDVDVIITESINNSSPHCTKEYFRKYGINQERLIYAKPDAILMHPGPINHNVEISTQLKYHPNSVILKQVKYGVAVRMAIFELLSQV